MLNRPWNKLQCIMLWGILATTAASAYTQNLPEEMLQITVPLMVSQQDNMSHITLDINGRAIEFMLDTGSKTGLHLPRALIDDMGCALSLLPEKEKSTDIAGKTVENDVFIAKQLLINGMVFDNIRIVEFQPWGISIGSEEEPQPDLLETIVGMGLFTGKQVLVDYPRQRLTIALPGVDLRDEAYAWHEIPWKMTDEGLTLQFQQKDVDKHKYDLVLDTGASITMISSKRALNLQLESCQNAGIDLDMGATPCQAATLQASDLPQLSPITALVLDMDFGKFEQDGLVGFNLLEKHPVLIDLPAQKIWIGFLK